MTGTPRDPKLMEVICKRIHAGEFKKVIEAETGVSCTTQRVYYRKWCKANKVDPRIPDIFRPTQHIPSPDSPPDSPPQYPPPLRATPPIPSNATVLAIPDLHAPFEHCDALDFLKAVKTRYNPDVILCLGDEADFAAFSRFPRDPDGLSPGAELTAAKEHLIPFYIEFPRVFVCTSNHTVRPFKQAFLAGIPEAFWPTYSMLLNAPDGWHWKDHWIIDGVRYIHGEGKSGQNAHLAFMRAYKTSICHGHVHSYGAVSYEGPTFAINAGCLINTEAYCFKYAKHMPVPVSLGCAIIHKGKWAEFIPMLLNPEGRWIGHL